ncbi:MAG: hypothetical protein HND39_16185 [Ignavibacteriota bacterium]|jgi:hypothetical protein|nr:MAG: hypothetical protein EDM72_09610 [Chlorobiota bacterium]MBE7477722.1 hypothetical protein [Ignavibacteriales bacterium]MBL1123832.1 hypothetical protein [Ignavibacteriota bacterium]MBV6420841.1 hypothetical protein [Ignavibacteriaceae bacterium]MCE7855038.1 hypothetical protein [Ignavibacteria bacterium CHB3]MEB2295199.1 hypothetical protein [Ignavibacteria bacterium]
MKIILLSLISVLLVYNFTPMVSAQQLNFDENTFFYPHKYYQGQIISSLGIALAKLPEDVVETDDVFRAPLFSYRMKYGLPSNFLAEGSIETNIVTFNFMLGPKWNFALDRFAFSAGTDLSFYIGKLEQFGFDTKFNGWALYPNITAGYRLNKFTVSVKSELVFNLAEQSKNGESEIENDLDFFNGWTIGVYIEQPFWGDNYVVLGIRSTFLKFYYPMWAAFSTFDRQFYIPEATFTFIF